MAVNTNLNGQSSFTWRRHLIVAFASQVAFAVPSLLLLTALGVINPKPAAFLFLVFTTASPLGGTITWLIDRGSNGENGDMAIGVLGAIPARLYGLLVGGLAGNHIAGPAAGLVGAIPLYFVGRFIGFRFGLSMAARLSRIWRSI